MSLTARVLGQPGTLTFENKPYKFGAWTLDVQAAFETWFVGKAYARLRACQAELGPEYPEERAALRRDVDAGEYDFGSALLQRSLRLTDNLKHLTYLCLCEGHRDDSKTAIDKALVDRIFKDPESLAAVIHLMEELNRDPNLPTPGEAGDASPSPEPK